MNPIPVANIFICWNWNGSIDLSCGESDRDAMIIYDGVHTENHNRRCEYCRLAVQECINIVKWPDRNRYMYTHNCLDAVSYVVRYAIIAVISETSC